MKKMFTLIYGSSNECDECIILAERNSRIFLVFTVASRVTRYESSMWEILQKKVYKTRITDLEEPKLDHVVIAAAIPLGR